VKVKINDNKMKLSITSIPLILENDDAVISEDNNHITIDLESEWLQEFLHTPKNIKVTIEII